MDTQKLPPDSELSELASALQLPEIQGLIEAIEKSRTTGRPGYPARAMIGMCLIKAIYALRTWSRVAREVRGSAELKGILGCMPSQWACYRFVSRLRERDRSCLDRCIGEVLVALHQLHPGMAQKIAIDGTDLPAWSNGHREEPSDPTASWGHRTSVGTRESGLFFGYKLHQGVCVDTDIPVAAIVATGKSSEQDYVLPLIDQARARGFDVKIAIMDKGYDADPIHQTCMKHGVSPVIPIRETAPVRRGIADPPRCEHGPWKSGGPDYGRKAHKYRCPTGECSPKTKWIKADRYHPLIPRESKRYKQLYYQRSAVERVHGDLKEEWALVPLRVRRIARVHLHAELTILARLACRLARDRVLAIPTAA